MSLYETVFIVRQDVSLADVDKLTEEFVSIISKSGGKVVKTEYWGLRNLAYDINNNKKGHYTLFGIDADSDSIRGFERKMKYSEDVIRFLTLRVDNISADPSPILKGRSDGFEETVDVTIS